MGTCTNGKFSIKSATWLQYNDLRKHRNINLINKLWKLNIQPKVKLFGWLLLRERLKTRDRIARFAHINDTSCPLCNEDNESANHLFGECSFAKQVWSLMGFPTANWSEGYIEVFNQVFLLQTYDKDLFAKSIAACWAIWKLRNDKVFRNTDARPSSVMALINSCTDLVDGDEGRTGATPNPVATIKWHAPSASKSILMARYATILQPADSSLETRMEDL